MDITIFDYDVTLEELKHLFVKYSTKNEYVKNTTYKRRLKDLYVLFKMREGSVHAKDVINELDLKEELSLAS